MAKSGIDSEAARHRAKRQAVQAGRGDTPAINEKPILGGGAGLQATVDASSAHLLDGRGDNGGVTDAKSSSVKAGSKGQKQALPLPDPETRQISAVTGEAARHQGHRAALLAGKGELQGLDGWIVLSSASY